MIFLPGEMLSFSYGKKYQFMNLSENKQDNYVTY